MYMLYWLAVGYAVARLFGSTVNSMDKGERRISARD